VEEDHPLPVGMEAEEGSKKYGPIPMEEVVSRHDE